MTPIYNPTAGAGGGGFHLARRDGGAEIFLPATGGPVVLTSGGAPNTFGAWTPIGTPAAAFWVSHLWAALAVWPASLCNVLVEFGYGARQTALDATRLATAGVDPTADAMGYWPMALGSRPTQVPAGEQVQARGWGTLASMGFEAMVAGWSGSYPTWTALPSNTVAGPGRYYPTNVSTAGVSVTSGLWGTWGASSAVVASAPNGLLVTQVIMLAAVGNWLSTLAVQVGYGPAGSETWCATVLLGRALPGPWVWPPVWVQPGERLAIRAQAAGVATRQLLVKVHDL